MKMIDEARRAFVDQDIRFFVHANTPKQWTLNCRTVRFVIELMFRNRASICHVWARVDGTDEPTLDPTLSSELRKLNENIT